MLELILALYDFGDMVRSATNAAAEDECDLSQVHARLPIFEALVDGYLTAARSFLTESEIAHLAFSGRLITFEIGIRFLTDFLEEIQRHYLIRSMKESGGVKTKAAELLGYKNYQTLAAQLERLKVELPAG